MTNPKTSLRSKYREALANQSTAERLERSGLITRKLCEGPQYLKAKVIFTYISGPQEVDTMALIHHALMDSKRVLVPALLHDRIVAHELTAQTELEPGPYGILQPKSAHAADPQELDLIIVPGLAFTTSGDRLGRGGGHFDRWLAGVPRSICKIGLAFKFQVARTLPVEAHDISVDQVISD